MLLNATGIQKAYGTDIILTDASLRLDAREKVALVGRNGAGKTTFLRILIGEEEPDAGHVQWASWARFGILRQHSALDEGLTVLESAGEARAHLLDLQARLNELEARLEEGPTDAELEEYAQLHEHFAEQDGYSTERDIRNVLARMGFGEAEFNKPVSALSGGERTRLSLARLLLEEPDVLILDEPTNHLDLDATEWLEGWIRNYSGAVLLVSHDRTFLNAVAERVVDMRDGETKSYPGPFEKFLKLRQEEDAAREELARKQAQQIAKLDEFVRRFINSQRTAQARGRRKIMERLKQEAVTSRKGEKGMAAGFGKVTRSGEIVVEAKQLTLAFGARTLFDRFDWTVRWGEKWGVIGANGAGKSTLMDLVFGELEPDAGTIKMGSSVSPGWFQQEADDFDLDASPLETVVTECNLEAKDARNLLGRFLISDDDALRPIRTLSGGERNKLQLAVLTALNPNLLVLDEPTNHLDMPSRDALAKVLREYPGTLILVSHDRWLLSEVTQQTLDLRRTGPVQYPGSYAEYRAMRDRPAAPKTNGKSSTKAMVAPEAPKLTPRELSKEIGKTRMAIADTEDVIGDLEEQLRKLEGKMANPSANEDILSLSTKHVELTQRIEDSMATWEQLNGRLEELVSMQGGRE